MPLNATAAIERFGIKQADLASIAPAIALPALGAFFGQKWGPKGQLIGGISGGLAGNVLREEIEKRQRQQLLHGASSPPGMPYAIDPTVLSEDIPPWALRSVDALKTGGFEPQHVQEAKDLGGDILGGPLYGIAEGYHKGGIPGAAKGFGGMVAGGGAGGALGFGTGMLLNHLLGRNIQVPGLDMSLPGVLGGIGVTLGGIKGLNMARG